MKTPPFYVFVLVALILAACSKQRPQPLPKYEHTIEEAFRVLDTCGIPELERLTIDDLNNYADQYTTKSLADSLDNPENYHIIARKVGEGQRVYYVETTTVILNFLLFYGINNEYTYWDTNDDGKVNTSDLLKVLVGWHQTSPHKPDLDCYDIEWNYGEGVTQVGYTCEGPFLFGFFHRTPADEQSPATYYGYDIYSFTLDRVGQDSTEFNYYIRP